VPGTVVSLCRVTPHFIKSIMLMIDNGNVIMLSVVAPLKSDIPYGKTGLVFICSKQASLLLALTWSKAEVSSLINTCFATHFVGQSEGDGSARKLTASPEKVVF
jgi:hypothetical protein